MTQEEALQQAAEEIQKKEIYKKNRNELVNEINKETPIIVNAQREKRIQELQEQQEAHVKVYKRESPVIAKEIDDILNLSKKEQVDNDTLNGMMNAIEFSNKVDEIRASFTDEASFNVFNRGVKEVGAEAFVEAYEKAGNNVFQALADVNGCKDILELGELDTKRKKDLMRAFGNDKESIMIEKIAQRVAEILKESKK
jgi:hypothetical protein